MIFLSALSSFENDMASTVRFNVGGREFEIHVADCYKSSKLSSIVSEYPSPGNIVFLNHNPDAFGVVVDFLRYGRILIPPSVCAGTVELIFDDLGIDLLRNQRQELRSQEPSDSTKTRPPMIGDGLYDEGPPQYTPMYAEKGAPLQMEKQNTGYPDTSNLVDQLTITVQQKITDLILSTIRPRITSQALQGAFRTTCVLLPSSAHGGALMSEFPHSNYTEMIYLDNDLERFLTQPEVERRFEYELMNSLEIPIKFEKKDVFFRSENEFGIAQTTTMRALVIYFELGRQLA
jgi:hypothetical protein